MAWSILEYSRKSRRGGKRVELCTASPPFGIDAKVRAVAVIEGMASDSEVAFKAAVIAMDMEALYPKFVAQGWLTFNDFAFSTSDPKGSDPEWFNKEVIEVLLGVIEYQQHSTIIRHHFDTTSTSPK